MPGVNRGDGGGADHSMENLVNLWRKSYFYQKIRRISIVLLEITYTYCKSAPRGKPWTAVVSLLCDLIRRVCSSSTLVRKMCLSDNKWNPLRRANETNWRCRGYPLLWHFLSHFSEWTDLGQPDFFASAPTKR